MSVRVLHVTSNRDGNIGGAERLLLDLDARFDPGVAFTYANAFSLGRKDDPYISSLQDRGLAHVNLIGVRATALARVFFRLRRFMQEGQFDVVHTHLLHGSFIGQTAARSAGVRARVLTRHFTNDAFGGSRLLGALDKRSLTGASYIVAVSEAVRSDVLEQGISEKKIRVIHNGIDIERFDRVLEQRQAASVPDVFEISTVGSLTPRKGHEFLIAAVAEVIKKHKDVRLTIIGEGPERRRLEALTGSLDLNGHVKFTGFRDDVAELVSASDIYAHSAIYEPFGIALTEAMALRKCVIAARTGGVSEIVDDGRTGVLVKTGNVAQLADALLWAYEHGPETRQMAAAGRERVETLFDLRLTAENYANLYREAMGR